MTPTGDRLASAFVAAARGRLAKCLGQIRHCLGQLDDELVWWRPYESHNSIANLVLHLCGNLRQWVVAGISGGPNERDRPGEFAERGPMPKDDLLRQLEGVAAEADAALAGVTAAALLEARRIQGFDETVMTARWDSLCHLNGHTQEIVCVTRLLLGDGYQFAWAPSTPEQGAPPAATA